MPDPPSLPPNLALQRLSGSFDGNWMIRAFGSPRQVQPPAIPLLGWPGMALLLVLLAGAGLLWLRRAAPR